MASPQIENGYTRISNELLKALYKTNFSSYQRRVFDCILYKTYGYHKKADFISISQIVQETGIYKSNVSRAIKELKSRNIIARIGNKLFIQKDYEQWKKLSNQITPKVISLDNKVISSDNKKLSNQIPTKEKQETYTKEKYASVPSQEEIKESSKPKIVDNLEGFSNYLYEQNIFPKVHAFVNSMKKKKKNPRAILHALTRVSIKHSVDKTINPWAYALNIIKVEDGNYNEQQHSKTKGKDI